MTTLDIHQIRKVLPHRYPFLLLDRVEDYEEGKWIRALKNVTANEPCFQGHFPHHPVFPGVLTLEAIAQAAAVLTSVSMGAEEAGIDKVYLFAGIDKARFKRPVEPGDQMIINVQMVRRLRSIWRCAGQATVDGKLCSSMELMFTYQKI
ncbi:MAG: 3-hydroxyacyl-[acyl-carrier-protein] dehydratase FabZ [marine bacterium B5-7]|nr:MAG: 3-hydroxyacyl-[acyl-carrier-protein] dehydratase FabZ [marine bacterium B5-7]